ncbi:MAG: carbon-nitrogen hydrolase family protein [bacterium]|nr:carbon-nitrogen hydrolase family protein [bacterium]
MIENPLDSSIPRAYSAAAVQMNSTADLQANLDQAQDLIAQAVAAGARLVGLPEYFAFLGPESELRERADEIETAGAEFLAGQAKLHSITLLGGALRRPANETRVYNCARLFGPTGEELACYDKLHLFDVDIPDGVRYRESDYTIPGAERAGVSYASSDFGVLGLSICYDLRFPELYRALSGEHGADVIFAPAAFTAFTGAAHWELLIRTRAVENTCYIIAPAQTGVHYGKRESYGHAMIVDPWGETLADAGQEIGFALARVDGERIKAVRARLPALRHRRLT